MQRWRSRSTTSRVTSTCPRCHVAMAPSGDDQPHPDVDARRGREGRTALGTVRVRRQADGMTVQPPPSARIATLTWNPALDVTTAVNRLEPWRKPRCGPATIEAGGGINVARAVRSARRISRRRRCTPDSGPTHRGGRPRPGRSRTSRRRDRGSNTRGLVGDRSPQRRSVSIHPARPPAGRGERRRCIEQSLDVARGRRAS